MATYEKSGKDLQRPATPPAAPGPPLSEAVQATIAQWLAEASRCAQCGQAAVRLQGWRGHSMLVLVAVCAQHGPGATA